MRIGIDFDGVIADTAPLKKNYVKRFHNKFISKEQTAKRVLGKIIGETAYKKMVAHIYGSDLTLQARAVKNAKSTLKELQKEHEIFIVTKRNLKESYYAEKWLQKKGISYKEILHTNKEGKETTCIKYNIKLLLEDRIDQLQSFKTNKVLPILLTRPFNKQVQVEKPIIRIKDWQEIIQIVKSLEDH